MKKLVLIFFASSAFALLPPLAQSTRELQALLSDAHMQDWLGSAELIKDIIKTEGGYLVLTQNYAMKVDIEYIRSDVKRIGPAHFQLQFHEPIDLKTGIPKMEINP